MGSNSSNTIRVVERAVREESDFFFFFSLPRVDGLFFFQFLPRAHGERNHWQPDSLIDEETRLDVTALGSGGGSRALDDAPKTWFQAQANVLVSLR